MSLMENRARSPPRNHFAGLDTLMRQRKSFTPVSAPAPRSVSLPTVASAPRFATRLSSGSEMVSPLAQPYRAPESVASFLQEQQEPLTSALRSDEPIPKYIPENRMEFKTMIETINDYDKATDSEYDHHSDHRSPSPPISSSLLAPDLDPSTPTGPDTPPTPADSVDRAIFGFGTDQTAVVRMTQQAWNLATQELDIHKKQKMELERKLAAAEETFAMLKDENAEVATKLGLVQFQIESTENQNAAMARALSEKDAMIKKNELEMKSKTTGIQDLDAKLKSKDAELVSKEVEIARKDSEIKKKHQQLGARNALISKANPGNDKHSVHAVKMAAKDAELAALKQTIESHKREIKTAKAIIKDDNDAIKDLRQKVADHQRIIDYHLLQNQHFADTVTAREKLIADLRQGLVVRKFELSEVQEQRGNRAAMEDIKGKLREMTTLCDRQKSQLKEVMDEIKFKEARIMDLSKNGERLRGAIHVVPPRANVKLPETVVACTECYGLDRRCDGGTKCRPCTENNTECLRLMCSLKYKNGDCPLVPCPLTHDAQGYLMLPRARPEW